MSVRVTYQGMIPELEFTTSNAWIKVPQTDPMAISKFGPVLAATLDMSEPQGNGLPYRLALVSVLRDAWLNNRKVEIILNLGAVLDMQSVPPGMPVPVDENSPYQPLGRYQFHWVCERVTVRADGR